ncbi:MAG: hypothetical protein HZC23_01570 [Rhodocyclales bacterium]|nr:hypothetical protein [Rhodocyclales bacterium]
MFFRYGLREIARGIHPDSKEWRVSGDRSDLERGSPAEELGPVPSLGPWPLEEQRRLNAVLAPASLADIANACPFPDWLGYLGLGLHYCGDAEAESRALTSAWIPRLVVMLPPYSPSADCLRCVADDSNKVLTWRMLEQVEAALTRA